MSQTNRFLRGLYQVVGVPERHRFALDAANANHKLYFQALAVVAASLAFGLISFIYSKMVLENSVVSSLLTALVTTCVVFLINRQTMIELRLEPDKSTAQLWTVRIGTIFMAATVSVLIAIGTYSEDIARLRMKDVEKAKLELISSPEYSERLKIAHDNISIEAKNFARYAEVTNLLSISYTDKAKAESEANNEVNGGYDPATGRARVAIPGAKYIYWTNETKRLKAVIQSLEQELEQLANSSQKLEAAKQQVENIKNEADENAVLKFQGKAVEFGYFFKLIRSEAAAWLPVLYGFVLSLLCEVVLLMAMTRSKVLDEAMVEINKLDKKYFQAQMLQAAMALKESSNQSPAVIRLSTKPRAVIQAEVSHAGSIAADNNSAKGESA